MAVREQRRQRGRTRTRGLGAPERGAGSLRSRRTTTGFTSRPSASTCPAACSCGRLLTNSLRPTPAHSRPHARCLRIQATPVAAHAPCLRHQRSSSHSSSTAARHASACPDVRSLTPRALTTPTHLPSSLRTLNQPHAGLRSTDPWPGIRNAPAHPPTRPRPRTRPPPPHPPAHTRTSVPPRARRLTVAARLGRVPLVPRLVHQARGRQRRDGGHGARGRPSHALAFRRAARVRHGRGAATCVSVPGATSREARPETRCAAGKPKRAPVRAGRGWG
jgi:hypothetical protein